MDADLLGPLAARNVASGLATRSSTTSLAPSQLTRRSDACPNPAMPTPALWRRRSRPRQPDRVEATGVGEQVGDHRVIGVSLDEVGDGLFDRRHG